MANFDDIKKTVSEKAGVFAEKTGEFAKNAAEKAKVLAKIGKLNAEILAEKDSIRKSNIELGKIYYEYFKADPHEPMKSACAKIDASNAKIAAKKAEIEDLKRVNPEVVYEADYTDCAESENEEKEAEADCGCECGKSDDENGAE